MDSESFVSDKSKSSTTTEQNLSEQLDTAKLAWWDVRLFGPLVRYVLVSIARIRRSLYSFL